MFPDPLRLLMSSLDDSQVKELASQLKDATESVRLKACDRIAKLTDARDKERAREVVPSLKHMFLTDGNPAVKFLAKKALSSLGQDPEQILREEKAKSGGGDDGGTVSKAALVRDLPILWRCAQDELRPAINSLSKLIFSTEERVLFQISDAFRKVGTQLTAYPLLLAFEEERTRPAWAVAEAENQDLFSDIRDLIDLFAKGSAGVNPALAAKMGNLKAPEVVASFVDMLRSKNRVLKRNSIRMLAEFKDLRTMDPLLRVLGSSEEGLDEIVTEALADVAREERALHVQILKKVLAHFRPSETPEKLSGIVNLVGRIGNPKTLDFVKGCLKHAAPEVRAAAIRAMGSFDVPPEARVSLLSPLISDGDDRVQGAITVALWGTSVQGHVRALVEKMSKGPTDVRVALARSIWQINAPDVMDILLDLLLDANPEVVRGAITSMRKLSDREAIVAFAKHVGSENDQVKVYCIETIGRHMMVEYNQHINDLATDSTQSAKVLSAAVLALGRLKEPSNLPAIVRFLKHDDNRVRANAVEALEALGESKVVPLIQGSVMDPSARTRSNACRALWKYGDIWVVDNVKQMIENENPDFHSSGAYCLGEMAHMVRNQARLVALPLLMMAFRRHKKFQEYQQAHGHS